VVVYTAYRPISSRKLGALMLFFLPLFLSQPIRTCIQGGRKSDMGANVQLTSHRLLLLFCEPLALSMNFPSRKTRMAGSYLSGIFDGHQKIGPLPFQQFHVSIYTGTNILKSSGDRCPTREGRNREEYPCGASRACSNVSQTTKCT
jgi:hypothetical protein